ncbi:60S ribosomal export protein NMD3-like [Paramacrobiotus metropolitanus]|uniref:60S ribosomal export protein NMD3-like n=1 Tax=Paramacrobiotus metropolitanus TaxID=2943436 RepID=UPI00244652F5|nr:60S ribosomal export protein NMD3-like [Paramacrobiotus metropolitanus]
MEYTESPPAHGAGRILCIHCGVPIEANPTSMCVACLRTQVDITADIPKQSTVTMCKSCGRYAVPPGRWQNCAPESKELLSVCLKRLKGLNQVRLVDAAFIWTEPHSRRLKIKVTVQKELMAGAVLQQSFAVEYVVHTQMCDDCHRTEAKDFWRALVQMRQKAQHKKTFYYLEQLILKHKAHARTVNIQQAPDGVDFFFANRSDARKFLDFILTIVPCQYKTSEQLLSHDPNNNIYNYKYTFSVEIVPVCKDDIVCLPRETAQHLGNISELCICTRVTSLIQLIDPRSGQTAELNANTFWREPFRSICTQKHLTEFTVLNVEHLRDVDIHASSQKLSDKHVVADIWVMRSSDLGKTEAPQYCTRSHLGHLLNPGDIALGFDLANSNVNEKHFEDLERRKKDRIPDVILVKKVFADRTTRKRNRQWKLRRLRKENGSVTEGSAEGDYEDFLEDLEEDANVRQGVNIYKDPSAIPVDEDDQDEQLPKISLQEMLDGLHLGEEEEGPSAAGQGDADDEDSEMA